MQKKKKIVKITLIALGITALLGIGGTLFWLGKKSSSSSSQSNSSSYQEQKNRLENEIAQLQTLLSQTVGPAERQRLQERINNLEQEVRNLPNNPGPGPNIPPVPVPTPLPPGTNKQLTIEYKNEVGDQYEYINVNNPTEKIYLNKNNSFAPNLLIKGNHYHFSFNDKDLTKDNQGNYIVEEGNKDKFRLTPAYVPPPPPRPGPNNPEKNPSPVPRPNYNDKPSDGPYPSDGSQPKN